LWRGEIERGDDVAEEREYLLGTDDDELARLGFQHQVWAADAVAAWTRAGFGPGQRLLDVGCGPGYATLDLARLVGLSGHVHGVDVSERFVGHLRARADALGARNVSAEVLDLTADDLPASGFDGAYARWLLCFVGDPAAVVRRVARSLRPGAAFVVWDYLKYDGLAMCPGDPAFDRVFGAMVESWRATGGDGEIGRRIPRMMVDAGLDVVHVEPVIRGARPGSALWQWPRTFYTNFIPVLVRGGFITRADADAFDAAWAERELDPAAFFSTPPQVTVIGRKR
jgi:SAM-dependent methyltransferase